MTRTWEEVFGRLDQWDMVDKLRALHLKSSSSSSSTGFLQFKSPDIAHLMANTSRRVRLFHHFHHNADDGLNDGTDELWALMGSGAMATAMAVNKSHVNEPQRGTTFNWSKMLAWNSTQHIKTMTKLSFTAPRDFQELACLVENMAGITEILFGFRSPLTDMLYKWRHFLTLSVGSTLATLRQLAHTDGTAACRLGWFIDRCMQQYLVLCAGVDHKEEINPSLLDFRTVRQQLEDGAFTFPACDFLRDKLGRGADLKPGAPTVTPSGSTSRTNRRAPPADEVINSQKDLFPKDPTDNWQVYLDHVRTGPVPNMCCRWHLNGKCRSSCFLRDSHVALTTDQVVSVKEWIKQCRSCMRRPTSNEGTGRKQKLGTSECAYSRSTFVAAPSKWSVPSAETLAWFANRTSKSADSPLHERTSRQDDSPFHKRQTPADALPVRPNANPTTKVLGSPNDQHTPANALLKPNANPTTKVQRSPNDQHTPADASPFRPYAASTTIVR
jgi:hypothetical protein